MDDQGRLAFALLSGWDSQYDAAEFFVAYRAYVSGLGAGGASLLQGDEQRVRWQLPNRQFYLSRAGGQVLALHAPDFPHARYTDQAVSRVSLDELRMKNRD